jgi:hypothetical protein
LERFLPSKNEQNSKIQAVSGDQFLVFGKKTKNQELKTENFQLKNSLE